MNTQPTAQRVRAAALWLRDTALGGLGYALVLTVALAGWSASFIGLHDFGQTHMHLSDDAAWLVPLTFDGAPAGLSIVVMRASTHGRPALVWRLLIIGFTGLSSWINYVHITDPTGRTVAAFMPPSAVILFEGLMSETRAAAERAKGRVAPRLHPLRWAFDRSGTLDLYRRYILGLPLPATLEAATEPEPTAPRRSASEPATATPPAIAVTVTPRQAPRPAVAPARPAATPAPAATATETSDATTAPATVKPAIELSTGYAPGSPQQIVHDLWVRTGDRPGGPEIVAALGDAGLPNSPQQARKIRAQVGKDHPELPGLRAA